MDCLEAKHAALKKSHTASMQRLQAEYAALKNSHGEQATSIERLEAENAALKSAVNEAQKMQQQKPERMPFHPEFLDFMRETFASEAMQACNAQRVVAETAALDAKVQIATLEAKINSPGVQRTKSSAQLEAAHSCRGLQTAAAHDTPTLCVPQSTPREVEDRLAELETENENLIAATVRDTAALRRAEACISDQQNKVAALEIDLAHLAGVRDALVEAGISW
ncbi:hypothetical protein C8R45DRAFT_406563 [Mycena sanguinolenta]|nr:hypothetical protein C8R45DRAFT_406563 [Mycena sanguinolenta]